MWSPKRKRYGKIISAVLVIVLVLSVVLIESRPTLAKETLPGIETVVSNNSQQNIFDIVELVPDHAMAELGYYIKGQEPIKLSEKFSTMLSKEERLNYINSLYDPSNGTGILGDITDMAPDNYRPLAYTNYTEKIALTKEELASKEWNVISYAGNPSTETLKGDYQLMLDDDGNVQANGDYTRLSENAVYEKAPEGVQGNYVENIQYYIYSEVFDGDYDLKFVFDSVHGEYTADAKKVNMTTNTLPDYAILYTFDGATGHYVAAGKKSEIVVDTANPVTYYTVKFTKSEGNTGVLYSIESMDYNPKKGNFIPILDNSDPYLEVPAGKGYLVCTKEDNVKFQYTPGTGRYQWVSDDTNGTEQEVKIGRIYYKGGFQSKDWFKKHVMDLEEDQLDNFYTTVSSYTPGELNATEVSNVDLFYLSGAHTEYVENPTGLSNYTATNDISWQRALDIINLVIKSNVPVIVDRTILEQDPAGDTNIAKLAGILMQTSVADFYNAHQLYNGTPVAWADIAPGLMVDADGNFVNNSIYVFDKKRVVNMEFKIQFTEDVVVDGFQVVKDEIVAENFYRENAQGAAYKPLDESVSEAGAIKYIINFANKRPVVFKSDIRILELQPTRQFELTVEKIKTLLGQGGATELQSSNITITQMTTSEFIGKIEDINSRYDMIYFGMKRGYLNKDGKGQTVYNDSAMNGLVYTHVGDVIYSKSKLAGILDTDFLDSNRNNPTFSDAYAAADYQENFNIVKTSTNRGDYNFPAGVNKFTKTLTLNDVYANRYSGNDITKEKLEDLEEFIEAGYPVVFANDFYKTDDAGKLTVDEKRVDSASYLYKFSKKAIEGGKKNIFPYQSLSGSLFASYLNLPKLNIELAPIPNTDTNMITKLQPNASGLYTLNYDFTIYNIAAISQVATRYDCKLYIDINADGKYSKSKEEIEGLTIYKNSDKSIVEPVFVTNDLGNQVKQYQLQAGVSYHLVRDIPEGYKGVLPWKVQVTQTDNSYIRNEVSGFARLMNPTKEEIRVLQIDSNNSTLTLQSSDTFKKLFALVEDFDVQVTSLSLGQFNTQFGSNRAYLDQFNMLILGFADVYNEIPNNLGQVDAILNFIKSGKSVLFTHDTTSFVNVPRKAYEAQNANGDLQNNGSLSGDGFWGYNLNRIIRDTVGMDRYGVTSTELPFLKEGRGIKAGTDEWNQIQASGRDIAYAPNSDVNAADATTVKEVQGYTNYVLNSKKADSGQKRNGQRYNQYLNIQGIATGLGDYGQSTIKKINDGQITNYPFKLPDKFIIAPTHGQYYQLNFDADDDRDGENDIVVWYTLDGNNTPGSNDMYFKTSGDVRNNYYIYNKGNITYSGVGHRTVNEQEAKLFVNTMIAAYNAGFKDPSLFLVEKNSINAREVKNYYVSYDGTIGDAGKIIDDKISINFYANDTNFVSGKKMIDVTYYKEDPAGDITLGDVKVSKIAAETFKGTDGTKVLPQKVNGSTVETINIDSNLPYRFEVPLTVFPDTNNMRIFVGVQSHINAYGQTWDSNLVYKAINIVRSELFTLD